MATSLFGHAGRSASKNLLEFRAGKMNLKGTTVTADKRKGLVYIYQSEDSLMHFCWKDRNTSKVEDVSSCPNHDEAKRYRHNITVNIFDLTIFYFLS